MTNRDAINILEEVKILDDTMYAYNPSYLEALDMALTALEAEETWYATHEYPQKTQWIPCSERLPDEVEKTYWVCTDAGYQCECRWTNDMYGLGTNEWSKWGWHVMDKPQYSKIIAYMPLPESYKGDSNG